MVDGHRMSRALFLLVSLAACSHPPALDGVDEWLDRWSQVRACLVEPAEDTATGIALARFTGRVCDPMTPLFVEVPDASPLHSLWRSAISDLRTLDRTARPSMQGKTIDRIDRAAFVIGLARGRWPQVVEKAPPLVMLGQVTPEGVARPAGDPPWPYPGNNGASMFAIRGDRRMVVAHYGFHGLEGIVFHASEDRGRTWRSENVPFGDGMGAWVDGHGGRVWRYLRRNGVTTLERFDADGLVNVFPARLAWRLAQRCRANERWLLIDGWLTVEGDDGDAIKMHQHDDLVACDQRGALVLSSDSLLRCKDTCQRVFVRPASTSGAATLLPDGRWMFVATVEGVAATWVEGIERPTFHRLPDATDEIVALEVVDGVPMALLGWHFNEAIELPKPPAATRVTRTKQP